MGPLLVGTPARISSPILGRGGWLPCRRRDRLRVAPTTKDRATVPFRCPQLMGERRVGQPRDVRLSPPLRAELTRISSPTSVAGRLPAREPVMRPRRVLVLFLGLVPYRALARFPVQSMAEEQQPRLTMVGATLMRVVALSTVRDDMDAMK